MGDVVPMRPPDHGSGGRHASRLQCACGSDLFRAIVHVEVVAGPVDDATSQLVRAERVMTCDGCGRVHT